MSPTALDTTERRRADAALALAEKLYRQANASKTAAERRLDAERGRMVHDLGGKQTLAALMDQAFRSRSNRVTAAQFAHILDERGVPKFFGSFEKLGLEAFRHLATTMPGVLVPIVKAVMQEKTKEVILPGEPEALLQHVEARAKQGVRLNVNHLGEMILGESEADAKTADDVALLQHPSIDCISVKASNLYSQISALAHDHSVTMMAERLRPRLRAAMVGPKHKLVNVDMEEYRDLAITLDAYLRVMAEPDFMSLTTGLALQAYVPDSYAAAERVIAFARSRVAKGGAPLRIRVVKGANMAVERVESSVRDLAVPTYEVKADTDANWKTMVELLSRPENIRACHLGVASHNIFDMAWAATLAEERGVQQHVLYEMLEGMANHVQRTVQKEVGNVLLYAPAVPKEKFLTAIAYLMRRFDELTDPNNFLSHIFGIEPGSPEWASLAAAFEDSLRRMKTVSHLRKRTQNRATEKHDFAPFKKLEDFRNERDTDWTGAENRVWLQREVLERFKQPPPRGPELADVPAVDAAVSLAASPEARAAWTDLSPEQRETILNKAAAGLARRRADFTYLAAIDVHKTIDQSDAEISEAIDFGRFYPLSVRTLREELPGATFGPLGNGVVAVISPWNFPIAIPAGGVFAALSAGNRVLLKPSPESRRVTTAIAAAYWEAGVPASALQVINCDNAVAAHLTANPAVDGVIFTGSTVTADSILSSRPSLRLFAETGGKNCTIITGKADRELAIKHLADSLRNNGQKCSATSVVIVTPETYADPEFWSQLTDAVASLPVGRATEPQNVVTPLFRSPGAELLRGLTTLEEGEEWVLQPRRVDGRDDFWSPGIKKGTKPGSFTHVTELFGPVITVMPAASNEEALAIVHGTGRGLTLGIETLDDAEFADLARRARVGVIYGRRSTVGAVVHRQTFGGWAGSRRGPGIHAGGINYVTNFMTVTMPDASQDDFLPQMREYFSKEHRPAQKIRGEDNVHRYRPLGTVVIRVTEGTTPLQLHRMACAATVAGNDVTVSFSPDVRDVAAVAKDIPAVAALPGIVWSEESDELLSARLQHAPEGGAVDPGKPVALLRFADRAAVTPLLWNAASAAHIYVETRTPLAVGRLELLRYLQEQTVSDTYHRYGGNLRADDAQ